MAEVYPKSVPGVGAGIEQNAILGVREGVVQGFQAPDWTDLRVGMYLSVTDKTDDNLITGIGPEGPTDPLATAGPKERYWIGIKDRTRALPAVTGTRFIGFSNTFALGQRSVTGGSVLTSSNRGVVAGTDYWWPHNSRQRNYSFAVLDGASARGYLQDGLQQHFVQNDVTAGGYAVLLGFRLQRDNPRGRRITIEVPTDGAHSADMAYTNDPSEPALETALEAWPTQVVTFGPIEMSALPDALFCYWPFRLSRLRIHAWGIVKAG
jgi:hypothetical protein